MRSEIRAALVAVGFVVGIGLSGDASAQIYKYKGADGTVVYTDSMGELPADRRAYYNERRRRLEAERQALERQLGTEEVQRREAEKQKAELMRKKMDEAERKRRLAAIEARLRKYKKSAQTERAAKTYWQNRVKEARARLKTALADFNKAKDEYTALAMQAPHTLFPGQAKTRDQAKAKMDALEATIDATIEALEVTIPLEARKAGIPRGWIR